MIELQTVPPEVCDTLRAANKVAVIGHVTPDADCLTSMGAMAVALRQMGKQVFAALPAGSVSRRLAFLVQEAEMTPATSEQLAACDLAVVLDTAKARRVNVEGKLDAMPAVPVLNVDHHATNPKFGKWNWVCGQRGSAAEMVYEIVVALGCTLTPTLATLLYAGIHSDTQGFSLSNTTPRGLQVGFELAAAGARVHDVCERLHRSHSRAEFDLLKVIYANTRVSDDGRLAWSTATHDEIAAAGCTAEDIDDQVEVPRSVEGITGAILFTEGRPRKVRMNFRGEGGLSILALAQQFGGGGHDASAGAILDGTIEEVTGRVLPATRDFLSQHAGNNR